MSSRRAALRTTQTVVFATALLAAAPAWADGPVAADPASNLPLAQAPFVCQVLPTGSACEQWAVEQLDAARASLGQAPYALPSDFTTLAPDAQALILVNLDRAQYGLPAVQAVSPVLDAASAAGIAVDDDPSPDATSILSWTSNWAGGYPNLPAAYDGWMYDDGPGSPNVDCTTTDPSGCWGHRNDVLWSFSAHGTLALGAAAGPDPTGTLGQAMMIAVLSTPAPAASAAPVATTAPRANPTATAAGGAARISTPDSAPRGGRAHRTRDRRFRRRIARAAGADRVVHATRRRAEAHAARGGRGLPI